MWLRDRRWIAALSSPAGYRSQPGTSHLVAVMDGE
nr:MAG TPA: hypothetical protein [Caudoviricetes sp.]